MRTVPNINHQRPVVFGLFALVLLLGGVAAWGSLAKISGAVIATGAVVVEGKPKSIQHLDGGIVTKIHISPGDQVSEEKVLIELDDTNIRANLAIYKTRLRDALMRNERLLAELNTSETFVLSKTITDAYQLDNLESSLRQQKTFMLARKETRQSQLLQLDEKIQQFENQITGVENLIEEKTVQIKTFEDETISVRKLVARQLAAKSRLMALDRSRSDMRGQLAEHLSEIARIRNSISETRIAKLQLNQEFREKVMAEIEQIEPKIDELKQQISATSQQLRRVRIKAPVSGTIHELNLFTIGGVVQPGQVLMQIIPNTGKHEIELNMDTQSIDQVYIGQTAIVRFPAFHQRTTPELQGKILSLSPSSVVDEKTGVAFFRVAVGIDDEEMSKLDGKVLIPGMPIEAVIPTEQRTVLSYLVKPLSDQLVHAFREE